MKLGCFLNGCCFGRVCGPEFPFSVTYPFSSQAQNALSGAAVYPSQVYESLAWLFIFMVLSITGRHGFKGRQMLVLLILFAISRFIIDGYRYFPSGEFLVISRIWAVITLYLAFLAYIIRKKSS